MDHTTVLVNEVTNVVTSLNVKVHIMYGGATSFFSMCIPYCLHCPKILMSVQFFLMAYVSIIVSTQLGHIFANAEMVSGVLGSISVQVRPIFLYIL